MRLVVVEARSMNAGIGSAGMSLGNDVPVAEVVQLQLAEERRRLAERVGEAAGRPLVEHAVAAAQHDVSALERRPGEPDARHDVVVVAGNDVLGVRRLQVQSGRPGHGVRIEVRREDEPVLHLAGRERRRVIEHGQQAVLLRREPEVFPPDAEIQRQVRRDLPVLGDERVQVGHPVGARGLAVVER